MSDNNSLFLKYKKRKRDYINWDKETNLNNLNINKNTNTIHFLKTNPFFVYNSTIIHTNDGNLLNNKFETYLSKSDKKLYLASPNHFNYQIYILNIKYNKIIKKLKGHTYFITSIRYFINKNNKKEYLISSDGNKWVIIWDINNDFDKKLVINTRYKNSYIYSCLILFDVPNAYYLSSSNSNNSTNENDDNINSLIIVSCNSLANFNGNSDYTNIYSLDNGAFLRSTYNVNTNCLLTWLNKFDEKEYIIELCSEKILIYNIFDENAYYEVNDGLNYMSGFIANKTEEVDYLFVNSIEKFIYIYNLNQKILVNSINVGGWSLYNIVQWNDQYILAIDSYEKLLKIIDINQGKAITCYTNIHSIGITSIKKIVHPIYGESILTSGKDNKIKLWTLK